MKTYLLDRVIQKCNLLISFLALQSVYGDTYFLIQYSIAIKLNDINRFELRERGESLYIIVQPMFS